MKSVYVRSRIEPELKKEAEKIMKGFGYNPSLVIQLLYRQIMETKKIPLGVLYNQETMDSIKEARNNKNLKSHKTMDELIESLNS